MLLVSLYVSLHWDGPLHKHQGTPAGQDDGQVQKVPLAVEIAPLLPSHELAPRKEP